MPGRRSGIGFRGGAAESHIEKVFPLETPADSSPLLRSRTAVWALQGWSGDPSGVGFLNMSTGSCLEWSHGGAIRETSGGCHDDGMALRSSLTGDQRNSAA